MASNLNPLPTITSTALGASLATGIAAGQYKAPTAVAGYAVVMDSANFYVEHQDFFSALLVTATATSTQNSGQFISTQQKGLNLFISVVSVAATTTMGINIQSQDPQTLNYVTIARASLDGLQTGATGEAGLQLYPGLVAQTSLNIGSFAQVNTHMGSHWRIQASITATASAGGAGLSFAVNGSKIL